MQFFSIENLFATLIHQSSEVLSAIAKADQAMAGHIIKATFSIPNRVNPQGTRADLAPGGIDLNAVDMGMTVTRDARGGVKINLDPEMLARIRRDGIHSGLPVIIEVRRMPLSEKAPLLGARS